jgi:hypothetical protein
VVGMGCWFSDRRSLGYAPPDFLLRYMALMRFMRLSLREGAHAGLSSAAWQEIRVGITKERVTLPGQRGPVV